MRSRLLFAALVVVMLVFCSAAFWMPNCGEFSSTVSVIFFSAGMWVSTGLLWAEEGKRK